jgi:hypothetical protein
MRKLGMTTGEPVPVTKQNRSRFLVATDAAVQPAQRSGVQPRG